MSGKPPWKKGRARAIGWQEAEQIEEKLRRSNKGADAVAAIADDHDVSQLTIRKIAAARGVLLPRSTTHKMLMTEGDGQLAQPSVASFPRAASYDEWRGLTATAGDEKPERRTVAAPETEGDGQLGGLSKQLK